MRDPDRGANTTCAGRKGTGGNTETMASVIMSCSPLAYENNFKSPGSWMRTWYVCCEPVALGFAAALSPLDSVFLGGMVIDVVWVDGLKRWMRLE
jgi:hypothetical protein